jgi:hypothetical protein
MSPVGFNPTTPVSERGVISCRRPRDHSVRHIEYRERKLIWLRFINTGLIKIEIILYISR